jgi:uncharacterized protein
VGGGAPEDEVTLAGEERTAFDKGVAEFNAGYFFECHDTLEEVWNGLRGPSRDFLQGLIQVSVAFYHLGGGNRAGALSMIGRALKRFAPYGERHWGFDLAALRSELERWQERARSGDLDGITLDDLPKWRFPG